MTSPFSTSELSQPVQIRIGTSGQAALAPRTVFQNFTDTCKKYGNKPALFQKRPNSDGTNDNRWSIWTWNEYRSKVNAFGKAMVSIGCHQKFDVVNIIGFQSPESFIANFGAIAGGCVAAGIYATNGPETCQYLSEHSKAVVVVVEGINQLEKYCKVSDQLPHLKAIVMYGPDELPSDIDDLCAVPVYMFEKFLQMGEEVSDNDLLERINSWQPGETCTLIYTSGTTGPPKAVMITHDNITWTTATMLKSTRRGFMDNSDCIISYLPLSHIAAQMIDMHMPMASGAQVYFAQPDALKGSLGKTLTEVRPTVFFGVPRVWEKIHEKLQAVARESSGFQKVISGWAKRRASWYWVSREFEADLTFVDAVLYYLAKIFLGVIHQKLGFDRCHGFYTAAAPIETKVLEYFTSLDIPIMEIYGQSECTGPAAVNCFNAFKMGSVGRPLCGTELRLVDGTGELVNRGRNIFAGYMNMPEKTRETIDCDGWLHSGDVATIDSSHNPEISKPSGFVRITGRIKELIITAGGENVPPVLIETQLKEHIPALSNAMVIGDKRKFLTVLLCLTVEIDQDGVATNKLAGVALETAKTIGSTATTTDEVESDDKWKTYFDQGVSKANCCAASRAQKVGKWSLLPSDFTEKGGELTPTLKLKRSAVASKYSAIIEAMYA